MLHWWFIPTLSTLFLFKSGWVSPHPKLCYLDMSVLRVVSTLFTAFTLNNCWILLKMSNYSVSLSLQPCQHWLQRHIAYCSDCVGGLSESVLGSKTFFVVMYCLWQSVPSLFMSDENIGVMCSLYWLEAEQQQFELTSVEQVKSNTKWLKTWIKISKWCHERNGFTLGKNWLIHWTDLCMNHCPSHTPTVSLLLQVSNTDLGNTGQPELLGHQWWHTFISLTHCHSTVIIYLQGDSPEELVQACLGPTAKGQVSAAKFHTALQEIYNQHGLVDRDLANRWDKMKEKRQNLSLMYAVEYRDCVCANNVTNPVFMCGFCQCCPPLQFWAIPAGT